MHAVATVLIRKGLSVLLDKKYELTVVKDSLGVTVTYKEHWVQLF